MRENYIQAMGVMRAPIFGSNRLELHNISFRSIFDHLFRYIHLIDLVLAKEFDEMQIETKPTWHLLEILSGYFSIIVCVSPQFACAISLTL